MRQLNKILNKIKTNWQPPFKGLSLQGRRPALIFVMAIIIVVSLLYIFNKPSPVAAWFNSEWHYRVPVTITNSGSAQTDFQTVINLTDGIINTSSLITAGKMQADCDDIRITNATGTILNYWIETGDYACNDTDTKIWVKIDSTPVGTSTLYIYYGNPNAPSYQDGDNVFEFFDDFEDGTIDSAKWTTTGTVTEASGYATLTNAASLTSVLTFGYKNLEFRFKNQAGDASNRTSTAGYTDTGVNNNRAIFYSVTATVTNIDNLTSLSGASTYGGSQVITDRTAWQKYKIERYGSGGVKFYQNDSLLNTLTTNVPTASLNLEFSNIGTFVADIEWIFVRDYTATEPSAAVPTSEDNSGAGPIAHWTFDEGQGSVAHNRYSQADTGPAPVAFWKMDDNVSGNAQTLVDASGNGNDGTTYYGANTTGMDCTVSGKIGAYSCDFDGIDDYVLVTPNITGGVSITISAWVYSTKINTQRIISNTHGTNGEIMFDVRNTDDVLFRTYTGDAYDNMTYTLSKDTWHFLTGTIDSSGTKSFYIDGILMGTSSIGMGSYSVTDFNIGRRPISPAEYFEGNIDHVKIYDYARSPEQIAADYKNTHGYITGATWENDGKLGKALSFDGTNDYATAGDNFDVGSNDFSFSLWIKPITTSGNRNVFKKGVYGSSGYSLWLSSSETITFQSYVTTNTNLTATFSSSNVNKWTHVVVTSDRNSSSKIYLNGEDQSATGSVESGNINTSTNFIVGDTNFAMNYYDGLIDDVKIWDRAISASEVKAEYNLGSAVMFGAGLPSEKADGLVGWWKMDESSGNVVDSSGNDHTGTPTGTTVVSGKYGNGRSFDGTNDVIITSTAPNLTGNSSLTVESWVKLSGSLDSNYRWILRGGSSRYFFGLNASNKLVLAINNIGYTAGVAMIDDTLWHHVVAVYDYPNISYYIDGVAQTLGSTTEIALATTSATLNIGGQYSGAQRWKGILDNVKIYNKARTPQQIMRDYLEGPPAVGHWKLDEGSGVVAYDYSGNGNNGTLNNVESADWVPGKIGSALDFGGTNEYVEKDAQVVSAYPFTTSTWFKMNTGEGGAILWLSDKDSSIIYYGIHTDVTTGKVQIWARNTTLYTAESTNTYDDNTWHYAAAVYTSATDRKLYIDNVEVVTSTDSVTYSGLVDRISIGVAGDATPTSYFVGKLDDVKIFNYALTPWQIAQEYNGGKPVAHWDFDDGQGYTARDRMTPEDTGAAPIGEWSLGVGNERLGSELVTNGGFDSDSSWNKGTGWTISGGTANADGTQTTWSPVTQSIVTAGRTYRVDYTITSISSGLIRTWVGGSAKGTNRTTTGSFSEVIAAAGNSSLYYEGSADFVGSIDNASLNELFAGDSAGANSGTIYGATYTTDRYGASNMAMSFDGTDDYINTGNVFLSTFQDSFTISSWVKLTDGQPSAIQYITSEANFGWEDVTEFDIEITGKLMYRYEANNNLTLAETNSAVFSNGQETWHQVVAVINNDTNQISLYFDGNSQTLDATNDGDLSGVTMSDFVSNVKLVFGARSFNNTAGTFLTGSIADVKLYDYARTAAQIKNDYNSANGRLVGDTTWKADGKFGKALYFDGTGDYVSVADFTNSKLDITDELTLQGWVKLNEYPTTAATIFAKRNSGITADNYFFEILSSDEMKFGFYNAGFVANTTTSADVSLNQWHHVAVSYSDSLDKVIFYKNGVNVGSFSETSTMIANNESFDIGYNSGANDFALHGLLDDLKIYNYARSPFEILDDYNQGYAVKLGKQENENADGLVGWWKLDDNVSGNGQTITDASGNSNNGTTNDGANDTGMDCTVAGKYGYGCNFDGTDDYVSLPSGVALPETFTIQAWVNVDTYTGVDTQMPIYGEYTSSTNHTKNYLQVDDGGTVNFDQWTPSGGQAASITTLSTGTWYHITAVQQANNFRKLYINGTQEATSTEIYNGGSPDLYALGRRLGTSYYEFNGKIDDVKIYNKARTPQQIMRDYLEGPPPVAHWDFNEGEGSYARDKSENDNDGVLGAGTAANMPTWAPGVNSSFGLSFDGTDDYVNAGNGSELNITGNLTLSAWLKSSGSGTHRLIDRGNYFLTMSSTNARFAVLRSVAEKPVTGSINIADNNWHHWVGVNDGTNIYIYVDGILDNSAALGGSVDDSSDNDLEFGRRTSGADHYLSGLMDDVKIYNYALTPYQVAHEFNNGKPVLHLALDEGQGQTAYDKSVHDNNGTLGASTSASTDDPTWQTSSANIKYGRSALYFDGGDYVDAGSSSTLAVTEEVTISLWFNATSFSNWDTLIGKFETTEIQPFSSYVLKFDSTSDPNRKIRFGVDISGTESALDTSGVFITGTWYHIVATYDGRTMTIYKNGVLDNSKSQTGAIGTNSNSVLIGDSGYNSVYYFNGYIDDVRIYNYARSPQEILEDYNAGYGVFIK